MQPQQFFVHADAESTHWWFVARRQIIAALIDVVLAPGRDSLIVDIGCGTGANTAFFDQSYRCIGVDPSTLAIEMARRQFENIQFLIGDNPSVLKGDVDRASAFMLCDVLEHVADDFQMLSRWLSVAKPGTVFLLTVPANPALWSPHDESHGHFRRYDQARFESLWSGLPVTALLVSYFNSRLYPLIKFIRLLNRMSHRSSGVAGTDLWLPPRWLNSRLASILGGEVRRLLPVLRHNFSLLQTSSPTRRFPVEMRGSYRRGVSLVAVLRRDSGMIKVRTKPQLVKQTEEASGKNVDQILEITRNYGPSCHTNLIS